MYNVEKVLELISKGETSKAIELLLAIEIPLETKKDIISISSEYQNFKKLSNRGVLTGSESNLTLNKLNNRLIEVVYDLPKYEETQSPLKREVPSLEPKKDPKNANQKATKNTFKRLGVRQLLLISILPLIIIGVYFTSSLRKEKNDIPKPIAENLEMQNNLTENEGQNLDDQGSYSSPKLELENPKNVEEAVFNPNLPGEKPKVIDPVEENSAPESKSLIPLNDLLNRGLIEGFNNELRKEISSELSENIIAYNSLHEDKPIQLELLELFSWLDYNDQEIQLIEARYKKENVVLFLEGRKFINPISDYFSPKIPIAKSELNQSIKDIVYSFEGYVKKIANKNNPSDLRKNYINRATELFLDDHTYIEVSSKTRKEPRKWPIRTYLQNLYNIQSDNVVISFGNDTGNKSLNIENIKMDLNGKLYTKARITQNTAVIRDGEIVYSDKTMKDIEILIFIEDLRKDVHINDPDFTVRLGNIHVVDTR